MSEACLRALHEVLDRTVQGNLSGERLRPEGTAWADALKHVFKHQQYPAARDRNGQGIEF